MVRATRGRRSGPMTMSATTAITISSENPTSNTGGEEVRVVQKKKPGPLPASACARRPSGLRFLLDLALDGVARHLGRGPALGRLVLGGFHAVFESAHRPTQVAADDMDVQMIHLLPAHTSGVYDDAKPVGRPLLARQTRRHGEDLAQYRLVAHVAIRE